MKACDFIARYLGQTAGIKHVFTFAGGTSAMILNSIARQGLMQIVPMRHEENVALAADGYARIKRGLGLALAMSGPGATNMMTGIAQSYFDSSPVFYLTGNVTTGTYKYARPVRQLGYQETDIVSIARPVTKGAYFVDRLDMVANTLRTCLRQCVQDRPGPTLYDVPFDIQKLEVDDQLLEKDYLQPTPTTLRQEDYQRFVELLSAARKPVLLLGGGIQGAGVASQVREFAKRFNLPVVVSLLGKDAYANDDPNYVGFIGAYGNRHANHVLLGADLVIALGSRIDSRQTGHTSKFQEGKTVIHVDVDPDVINSTVDTALGICLDLRTFLDCFLQWEKDQPVKWKTPQTWWDVIHKLTELLGNVDDVGGPGLNPKLFLQKLSQAQAAGTIYTGDVGSNQMWTAQNCVLKEGDRILYSGGLGTMGYAIPAAIGAHFAAPASPVVAVVGDGGMQMALPELSTISEFQIPIKIVVLNNGVLGLMRNFQDENYEGLHPATETGYRAPSFSRVADAYDIPSFCLESDDQTDKAIQWLADQKGSALLEVKIDPEWGPQPKVVRGEALVPQNPPLSDELQAKITEVMQ